MTSCPLPATAQTIAARLPRHLDRCERAVVGQLVADILAAGLDIAIFDGENWSLPRSREAGAIAGAIAATDESTLVIRDPQARANGRLGLVGSVYLVHGEGADVIADYTDWPGMEPLVERAMALASTEALVPA